MKKNYFAIALIVCLFFSLHNANGQSSDLLTSIGNLNVTTEVDALAQVYVDEIDKDIDIYFFQRFAVLLNNYPELKTLFPATTTYLNYVPDYQYTTMLSTLRAAFYKDLKTLPGDITQIAVMDPANSCKNANNSSTCSSRITNYKTQFNTTDGRIMTAALLMAQGIINKSNAAVILNSIATFPTIDSSADVASNILKLLNDISLSLVSNNKNSTWIEIEDYPDSAVQILFKMKKFIQADNIQFGGVNIVQYFPDDTAGLRNYVNNFISNADTLDAYYYNLKNDTAKADKTKNIANFIEAFNGFFLAATNYNSIDSRIPKESESLKRVFNTMSKTFEITGDMLMKNYQLAVFNSVVLVDTLLTSTPYMKANGAMVITKEDAQRKQNRDANEYAKRTSWAVKSGNEILGSDKSLAPADKDRIQSTAPQSKDSLTVDSIAEEYYKQLHISMYRKKNVKQQTVGNAELKANLLKYGTLLANVVTADSASQITAAIEAAAIPPGSSIVKKTKNFSVDVQGYAGLPLGATGQTFSDNFFKSINTFSPYAPLGIAFSIGLKPLHAWKNETDKRSYGSLSLFLQVIDIGAIVAYDFTKSPSAGQDTMQVRLQNIFAPGVSIIYGIPGVPLSVGGGFQYQPSLTTTTSINNTTISETSGFRWQIFAAFDLPFFNLYTSQR